MSRTAILRARLAGLDDEISLQGQLLLDLETSRDAVLDELASVASYPVLTLPVEITSRIFEHSLCHRSSLNGVNWNQLPLIFLRVCKTWARIASATTALWTTVFVDLDEWENGNALRHALEVWFGKTEGRFAGKRLEVHIVAGPPTALPFESFMEPLRAHSARVSVLRLELSEVDTNRFKLQESLRLDVLEEIMISTEFFNYPVAANPFPGLNLFVLQSPGLRTLDIGAIPFAEVHHSRHAQITHFQCQDPVLSEICEMLHMLPNLVYLCVLVGEDGNYYDPTLHHVIHPRLEHLHIIDPGSGDRLLEFLTLPRLAHLEVMSLTKEVLLPLLDRSATASLTKLSLGVQTTPHFLPKAAAYLDKLVDLTIRMPQSDLLEGFFALLGNDEAFLPSLQRLSFDSVGATRTEKVPLEMIALLAAPAILQRNEVAGMTKVVSFRVLARQPLWSAGGLGRASVVEYLQLRERGVDVWLGTYEKSFI